MNSRRRIHPSRKEATVALGAPGRQGPCCLLRKLLTAQSALLVTRSSFRSAYSFDEALYFNGFLRASTVPIIALIRLEFVS
jgi:hypothetical protein